MAHLGLSEDELSKVYQAERGTAFNRLILSLLSKGKLKKEHIKIIFDPANSDSRGEFERVFTHKSADEENNYESNEFLGDLVLNHCIGKYLSKRFPQLDCAPGVRVITRLKINLVSKKYLSQFAENLGFWDYIKATMEYRMTKKKPILEDCFEAVLGLIEKKVDRIVFCGGFRICYNIVASCLDNIEICGGRPGKNGVQSGMLVYKELVDAKTRLKELFDVNRENLGKLKYESERVENLSHSIVSISGGKCGNGYISKRCTAALKADSQQLAAQSALEHLEGMGIKRGVPRGYDKFCV